MAQLDSRLYKAQSSEGTLHSDVSCVFSLLCWLFVNFFRVCFCGGFKGVGGLLFQYIAWEVCYTVGGAGILTVVVIYVIY